MGKDQIKHLPDKSEIKRQYFKNMCVVYNLKCSHECVCVNVSVVTSKLSQHKCVKLREKNLLSKKQPGVCKIAH